MSYRSPYWNNRFFNADAAAFEIPIKYIQFRPTLNKTIVVLTAPTNLLKTGIKLTIVSPNKTFNAVMSGGAPSTTTATPYIWLDLGIDYTNGQTSQVDDTRWVGGSILPYSELASRVYAPALQPSAPIIDSRLNPVVGEVYVPTIDPVIFPSGIYETYIPPSEPAAPVIDSRLTNELRNVLPDALKVDVAERTTYVPTLVAPVIDPRLDTIVRLEPDVLKVDTIERTTYTPDKAIYTPASEAAPVSIDPRLSTSVRPETVVKRDPVSSVPRTSKTTAKETNIRNKEDEDEDQMLISGSVATAATSLLMLI